MAISFSGRAYFCKVNTDEVAVANMMQIRSLPTFLVIKDGQIWKKYCANVEGLREGITNITYHGKSSKSK